MKKQRLRLEIKEISTEGTFEGMLSPYGNVDGTGDVVEPGAFTKTLKERGNKVPLLWQHSPSCPIGDLTLEDRPEGLWCKGQLLMQDSLAQRAYLFVKAQIVRGLSIGFETLKDSVESGVRHLKEIRLYEGSIVTFPANESALIFSVKGSTETKGDFNEELAEAQLQDAGGQMRCALWSAIYSVTWGQDLTRGDKIAAAEAVIQQFTDAFMAYFPAYLDMLAETYGEMNTWYAKKFETKAGRKLSAATMETMKSACEQIKAGHESLMALMDEEAGEDDSTTLSPEAAKSKSEPENHSAILNLLDSMRLAIPAA